MGDVSSGTLIVFIACTASEKGSLHGLLLVEGAT
jgi:hypothetical protein